MNIKKTTLATALIGALSMGFAGQASASVYAGSSLNLSNLTIGFINASTGVVITNLNPGYTFNVEDSATLNGSTVADADACSKLLLNCGVSPVLKVSAVNAPGSTVIRADNDYSLFGQNSGTFANANAEITSAQLVNGTPSSTKQVAEAELQISGQGQASTNIQSNTTWTFSFSIGETANMVLSFLANPEMKADVTLVPPYTAGNAQANMSANFTLRRISQISGDAATPAPFVNWTPDGVNTNAVCVNVGSCVDVDPESLNETMGVGPGNSTVTHSLGTAGSNYSLTITGLTRGNYSLTLAGLTSVNVTQVPEPGTLMLLGGALAALGFGGTRRRSQATAA